MDIIGDETQLGHNNDNNNIENRDSMKGLC